MTMTDPAKLSSVVEKTDLIIAALERCFDDVNGKTRPHQGIVECPACGCDLHYLAKTSAPGTIWGKCVTEGCLVWMV